MLKSPIITQESPEAELGVSPTSQQLHELSESDTLESKNNQQDFNRMHPKLHSDIRTGNAASDSALDVVTPRQIKGKERKRTSGSSSSILEEELNLAKSLECKLFDRAMLVCKCHGLMSPIIHCQVYDESYKMTMEALMLTGEEESYEMHERFQYLFNKSLLSLISSLIAESMKSPDSRQEINRIRDLEHQPSMADTLTTSQLGVDIEIPQKMKSTHFNEHPDPNIEEAMARLNAPQYPGENTQVFKQRRAATVHVRNASDATPAPAFIGKAGPYSMRGTTRSAKKSPIQPKAETESSASIPI